MITNQCLCAHKYWFHIGYSKENDRSVYGACNVPGCECSEFVAQEINAQPISSPSIN